MHFHIFATCFAATDLNGIIILIGFNVRLCCTGVALATAPAALLPGRSQIARRKTADFPGRNSRRKSHTNSQTKKKSFLVDWLNESFDWLWQVSQFEWQFSALWKQAIRQKLPGIRQHPRPPLPARPWQHLNHKKWNRRINWQFYLFLFFFYLPRECVVRCESKLNGGGLKKAIICRGRGWHSCFNPEFHGRIHGNQRFIAPVFVNFFSFRFV